jgi:hypothetical protein
MHAMPTHSLHPLAFGNRAAANGRHATRYPLRARLGFAALCAALVGPAFAQGSPAVHPDTDAARDELVVGNWSCEVVTLWDNGASAKAHEDAAISKMGTNEYIKNGTGSATLTQAPGFVWPDTNTDEPRTVALRYREAVSFVNADTVRIFDLGSRDFAPGVSAVAHANLWQVSPRTMTLRGSAPGSPGVVQGTCTKR